MTMTSTTMTMTTMTMTTTTMTTTITTTMTTTTTLAGFDSDKNNLLDASELSAWRSFVQGMMADWKWEASPAQQAAFAQAWNDAQDADPSSASMIEIARFLLATFNIMLQ